MDEVIKRIAAEVAPQLDEAINGRLGAFRGSAEKLATVLDENKVGHVAS